MRILKSVLFPLLIATLSSSLSYAATGDRIAGAIDSTNLVEMKGHVSPMARAEFDQGPVEPFRALHVTMLFAPTAEQQRALDKLLAAQQDTRSASFHQWLTPEQYGERFGLSQSDLEKMSAWLEGQGFKVTYVARGRDFLSFDGIAAQVEQTFKTEIHYFNVNGTMHFANTMPPSIPAALNGIVGGFRGLHDFLPHSMLRKPAYTTTTGVHFLAPGDIATIYDINPLYKLSPAIDGTGQQVVIAGQTDVYLADLHNFRTDFGLSDITGCTMSSTTSGVIAAGACSSGNFEMVVPSGSPDPGLSAGDLGESDLDIEWVGSVARGAEIIFVTSAVNSGGVDTSASWAIDNKLAPVISYSYGICEAFATAPGISSAEGVYKKAAGEGISFFAAAGDSGAAECDGDNGTYPAILGLSVSYPASSPEITAVGGTEFDEGSGSYWNTTNNIPGDGGSAKSYIPEIAWNDSAAQRSLDATGGGPSNCAFGTGTTSVSGPDGGPFAFEICSAPTAGGFSKPSWQSGITPNDSVRDIPDISFSASNANDVYIVCVPLSEIGLTGSTSTCANGINSALTQFNPPSAFGGTSAPTPVAAGMTVLLNQYLGASGLGTINQQLYTLYKNNPPPTGPFHDIVAGTSSITGGTSDNIVPCTNGDPTFEPTQLRCAGTTMGYSAGAGYDLVTGLGSVDINTLATTWAASQTSSSFSLAPQNATYQVTQGQSINVTINLTTTNGFNSPLTYTCTEPAALNESTCIGPSGATTQTSVSFQITTTAPTAKLQRPFDRGTGVIYAALLPGLLGITFTFSSRKRSRRSVRILGMIVVLGISTLWLGSCGGNNSGNGNPGTTKGSYTITINATTGGSSPMTGSTTFTLQVQQ